MIRVNLFKNKKKSGGNFGENFFGRLFNKKETLEETTDQGAEDGFDIKNSSIVKILILGAIIFATNYWIEDQKKIKLESILAEQDSLQKETKKLTEALEKSKGYETTKSQLEQYERAVRIKLETINKLIANRTSPSKMLVQIAQTIPNDVWLSEMKVTDLGISIAGNTPGYSQVSDFLNTLEQSSFLFDPKISGIQENLSASKEQIVQSFEVTASRRKME